jgi:hypothetical protein
MSFYQASVTSNGAIMGLNNSTLTVQNGPLLSLTGGSQMTVTGDFLNLTNGSKITVLNGPLIFVDGQAPTGISPAFSTLTVSGALVNFGGTGGNQVIINNTLTPTATLNGGIPVSQTGTGSSITIPGSNPIKNPSLGTVKVNGTLVTPTGGAYTGSVIQVTNGGRVTITAP